MKITKILLATSIVAISTTAFASNGGFYIGANTGASLEKYSEGGLKAKKTKVIAEGVLGYDFHFDTVVLGMDFEFGTTLGKVKKTLEDTDDLGNAAEIKSQIKTQWQLGFMPRVGYLITPDCEIYLTAGARVVKHKSSITLTVPATNTNSTEKTKKTKVHPVVGLGMKYDFTPNFFAKAEYNYLFKTKVVDGLKYQTHAFKLGFGYKF